MSDKQTVEWELFFGQMEALAINIAIAVAGFYKKLIAEGIDEETAESLTTTMTISIFGEIFRKREGD